MSTTTTQDPFTRKATDASGGNRELPGGGSYPAALVGIIDLGTHEQVGQKGDRYDQRKLFLVWELTGENDSKGETFKVGKDFPFPEKMSSKNPLRKLLESWNGRAYRDDEDVAITPYLGKPCLLSLTEGESAKKNKFVTVSGIQAPVKGMTIPPVTVPLVLWSFEGQDPRSDPKLPEWVPGYLYGEKLFDVIKTSKEWLALTPF